MIFETGRLDIEDCDLFVYSAYYSILLIILLIYILITLFILLALDICTSYDYMRPAGYCENNTQINCSQFKNNCIELSHNSQHT